MRKISSLLLIVVCLATWMSWVTPVSANELWHKVYDPARDPGHDAQAARDRARRAGRHVLLVVGSDDCIWCFWLDRHLHKNPLARDAIRNSFELVHVYYGEANRNQLFFAGLPEFQRFPHLYVMDTSGEILASRDASVLMKARKFDTGRISAFAASWADSASRVTTGAGAEKVTEEKQYVPG